MASKQKTCSECNVVFSPTNNRQLACTECKSVRELRIKRERRKRNPSVRMKQREAVHRWRVKNRDKVLQSYRDRYWSDPERYREEARQYQTLRRQDPDYREKAKLYAKAYRSNNGAELNRASREKYSTDQEYREQCKRQAKEWRMRNLERARLNCRLWARRNPERLAYHNMKQRSRNPIDPEVIQQVFARDDYKCVYCETPFGQLSIDHLTPLAKGGTNDVWNLAVACMACNTSKGAKMPLDFIVYRQRVG